MLSRFLNPTLAALNFFSSKRRGHNTPTVPEMTPSTGGHLNERRPKETNVRLQMRRERPQTPAEKIAPNPLLLLISAAKNVSPRSQ
jgi:hypothetical protein